MGATTDSDLITTLLAAQPGRTPGEAAREVLPTLRGAFCLTFMDQRTLYAARDPHGVRPLVLGRLDRGWVVASETAALDIVGGHPRAGGRAGRAARHRRGRRAQRALRSRHPEGVPVRVRLPRASRHHDRRALGQHRTRADRAHARLRGARRRRPRHPVPESGHPGGDRLRRAERHPYGQGLVKNAYVGRTFIQPSQTIRQLGIRLKLNPLREVIAGKRLVVVDDSIVRGNTQRRWCACCARPGAAEVHVRISSPPVMWPCFYGIDFASRAELIASAWASRRSGRRSAPTRSRSSRSRG
jgi:amidophosphoribosyltransferase